MFTELLSPTVIVTIVASIVALVAYVAISRLSRSRRRAQDTPKAAATQKASSPTTPNAAPRVRFQIDSDQPSLATPQSSAPEQDAAAPQLELLPFAPVVASDGGDEVAYPPGSIDCLSHPSFYPSAVTLALRGVREQGVGALDSILPLSDNPPGGSTHTDGLRWYSSALVTALPPPTAASPLDTTTTSSSSSTSTSGSAEQPVAVASSGVCRVVLVGNTVSLYAMDELAEIISRKSQVRAADQKYLSSASNGEVPSLDTSGDERAVLLNPGDTLIGRIVLSSGESRVVVEPTYVESHITGSFTVSLRVANMEEGTTSVVRPVEQLRSDVVVYGPHFKYPHATVAISFETYFEAQLWYKLLSSRISAPDTITNSPSDRSVSPARSKRAHTATTTPGFNTMGYSSGLTTAFGRGVLAHGAKLVEDLLSAHDYIYDACSGTERTDVPLRKSLRLPKGFRMPGCPDDEVEPETAVIPPRAVLLHARQVTVNSLSTRAAHRSCCGVGMLPVETPTSDNRTVVLNLVDMRAGQTVGSGADSVSETLARDYGLSVGPQLKGQTVSLSDCVSPKRESNDVTVCGFRSVECAVSTPTDSAYVEALVRVNLYNSGPADEVVDEDEVTARKKFSEPTAEPEEPVGVSYAYVRFANVDGTAMLFAPDEDEFGISGPCWGGFRAAPAASIQCALLSPAHHPTFFGRLPPGSYHDSLFPHADSIAVIEETVAGALRTALFEQTTLPHCVPLPSAMIKASQMGVLPTSRVDEVEVEPRMVHDLIENTVAIAHPSVAPLAPLAPEDEEAEAAYHAFRYPADSKPPASDSEDENAAVVALVEPLSLTALAENDHHSPRAQTPTSSTRTYDSRLRALLPPSYRDRVVTPKRGRSSSLVGDSPMIARATPIPVSHSSVPPLPLAPVASLAAKEVKHTPRPREYFFTTPRHHRPAAFQSPLRRMIFSGETQHVGSTPLSKEDSSMLDRYRELRSELLVEEGRQEEVPLGTIEEKLIYAKLLEKERKRASEEEEARFRGREEALQETLLASRNAAIAEQQRNLAELREREEERERQANEAMARLAALEDELARTKEEGERRGIEAELLRAAEEEEHRQQEREEADRMEAERRKAEENATLQRVANTERALEAVRSTLDKMAAVPSRPKRAAAPRPQSSSTSSSSSSSLFDSSASESSMGSSGVDTPTRATANPDDSPRTQRKQRRRARHDARKVRAKRLRALLRQKEEDEQRRLREEVERRRQEDAERHERFVEAERNLRELQANVALANSKRDREEEERRRRAQEEELQAKINALEAQVQSLGDAKDVEKESALAALMKQLVDDRRSAEQERADRLAKEEAEAKRREEQREIQEAARRQREDADRKRIEDTERALALLVAQQEREFKERERRDQENEKLRKEEIRMAAEAAKAAALAVAEEERRRILEEEARKAAQRDASHDVTDDETRRRIDAMESAVVSLQSQMFQHDDAGSNAGSRQAKTPRSGHGSRVPTPRYVRNASTMSASRPPLPPSHNVSRTQSQASGVALGETDKERARRVKREEKEAARAAKKARKAERHEQDALISEILREDELHATPFSVTRGTSALFRDSSMVASPAPTNMTLNAHEQGSPVPTGDIGTDASSFPPNDVPSQAPNGNQQTADNDRQDQPPEESSDNESQKSGYDYKGNRYSRSQPIDGARAVTIGADDLASDHVLTNPEHVRAAEAKLAELIGGDVNSRGEVTGQPETLAAHGFELNDLILTFNDGSVDGRPSLLFHVYHAFCADGVRCGGCPMTVLRSNGDLEDVTVGDHASGRMSSLEKTNGEQQIGDLLKAFVRPSSRSRARDGSTPRHSKHHHRHRSSSALNRNEEAHPTAAVDGDAPMSTAETKEKRAKDKSDKKDKEPKADKKDKIDKKTKKEKLDKVDKKEKKEKKRNGEVGEVADQSSQ